MESLTYFLMSMLSILYFCDGSEFYRCPTTVQNLSKSYSVRLFRDRCYIFVNYEGTWVDADTRCRSWGGNLITIPNQETMNFVKDSLNNVLRWRNNGVWIGAHARSGGQWRWQSGGRVTWGYWEPGQPSTSLGISFEDCALMRRGDNWRWHDYHCDSGVFYRYKFICEFNMSPPTTTTSTTTTTQAPPTTVKSVQSDRSNVTDGPSLVENVIVPLNAPKNETESKVKVVGMIDNKEKVQLSWADVKDAGNTGEYGDTGAASGAGEDTPASSSDRLLIGLAAGGIIMLVLCLFGFVFCRRRFRRKKGSDEYSARFTNLSYAHVDQSESSSPRHETANGRLGMDSDQVNRIYDVVNKDVNHGVNHYVRDPLIGAVGGDLDTIDDLKGQKTFTAAKDSDGYEVPLKCSKFHEFGEDDNEDIPPPTPHMNNLRHLNQSRDIPEYHYIDVPIKTGIKNTNIQAAASFIPDPNKPSNLAHQASVESTTSNSRGQVIESGAAFNAAAMNPCQLGPPPTYEESMADISDGEEGSEYRTVDGRVYSTIDDFTESDPTYMNTSSLQSSPLLSSKNETESLEKSIREDHLYESMN